MVTLAHYLRNETLAAEQDYQQQRTWFAETLAGEYPEQAMADVTNLSTAIARRELMAAFATNHVSGLRAVNRWLTSSTTTTNTGQTLHNEVRATVARQFLAATVTLLTEDELRAAVGGLQHLNTSRED